MGTEGNITSATDTDKTGLDSEPTGLDVGRRARGLNIWPKLGLVLLGVVILALLPQVLSRYYVILMLPFFAYGIALLGLNLLFSYTGLISFGHALFIGVGAYSTAFLMRDGGLEYIEPLILLSVLGAVVVAIPVAMLTVRYVGIYFGLLTLAFGMLCYSFLLKFYSISGGDQGIRVGKPHLLGFIKTSGIDYLTGPFYYYCLGLLVIMTFVMWRIVRSPFGLTLRAVRDNSVKAESLGMGVYRYRFYSFLISAIYGSVAGVILAVSVGQVDPGMVYWTSSSNLVLMTVLGGFTNFLGPIVGAGAFILLQDQVMSVWEYWRLVFGAILAVIVIFAPSGLMGVAAWAWNKAVK